MSKIILCLIVMLCQTLYSTSNHKGISHTRAHAPIGVMGDHTHDAASNMVSYRWMSMSMSDLSADNKSITPGSLAGRYMMAPKKMKMNMHMLGLMRGLSHKITIMSMLSYQEKRMTSVKTMTGDLMSMHSNGISDLHLSGLFLLKKTHTQTALMQLGLTLPIGSISKKNEMGAVMPYGMQLGSGTPDLILSSTTSLTYDRASLGGQVGTRIRLGQNRHHYRLGHQVHLSAWTAVDILPFMSLSLRLLFTQSGHIQGKDTRMTTHSPAADPTVSRHHTSASIGSNIMIRSTRIALEYTMPIQQSISGIGLQKSAQFTIGAQQSF